MADTSTDGMYVHFDPFDYTISEFGDFVDFGAVKVPDPENNSQHAVTIDHVVVESGDVWVRINGLPLDEVGEEAGSHVR